MPLIYTITNGTTEQAELIRNSIENRDTSQIEQVVAAVQASGGLQYTREMAEKQVSLAKQQLQTLPNNSYRTILADLADFALARSF